MKTLIILYIIVMAGMVLMIPLKLLTSVQSRCHKCGDKIFYSKRKKNFMCPHCGTWIIMNGRPAEK